MNRYRKPYWATSSNETEVHSFNPSFTQTQEVEEDGWNS